MSPIVYMEVISLDLTLLSIPLENSYYLGKYHNLLKQKLYQKPINQENLCSSFPWKTGQSCAKE